MGAFGAHALRPILQEGTKLQVRVARCDKTHIIDCTFQSWQTATQYQLLHSVALMSLYAASKQGTSSNKYDLAAKLWVSGTALFSGTPSASTDLFADFNSSFTGSIYLLCLGGPRLLGPVTPIGGMLLMAGWVAFGMAAGQ